MARPGRQWAPASGPHTEECPVGGASLCFLLRRACPTHESRSLMTPPCPVAVDSSQWEGRTTTGGLEALSPMARDEGTLREALRDSVPCGPHFSSSSRLSCHLLVKAPARAFRVDQRGTPMFVSASQPPFVCACARTLESAFVKQSGCPSCPKGTVCSVCGFSPETGRPRTLHTLAASNTCL